MFSFYTLTVNKPINKQIKRAILIILNILRAWISQLVSRVGYWLNDRGVRVQFSAEIRNYLFSMTSKPALGTIQPPMQLVRGLFPPG
jgi:hypothetical protein